MPHLDIPHRVQLRDGYCMPACVEMALAYYGIERSQTDLAQVMGVIPDVGVSASRVLRLALRRLAISRQSGDKDALLSSLTQGIPPILEVNTSQLPYWTQAAVGTHLEMRCNRDASVQNLVCDNNRFDCTRS